MRIMLFTAAAVVLAAGISLGASLPAHAVSGNYIEARTADVWTGPCFANGELDMNGREAVLAWKINHGSWHGVDLSGLAVVGVVRTVHTLGDPYQPVNPARAALIVDSRASREQRAALEGFAKAMAGDLLQNVVAVDAMPIELEIADGNIHGGVARLTAGSLASIQTRALSSKDHTCGNEDVFYPPLSKLEHAMPAYALADSYTGSALDDTWSSPYKRSSFLGTFEVPTE